MHTQHPPSPPGLNPLSSLLICVAPIGQTYHKLIEPLFPLSRTLHSSVTCVLLKQYLDLLPLRALSNGLTLSKHVQEVRFCLQEGGIKGLHNDIIRKQEAGLMEAHTYFLSFVLGWLFLSSLLLFAPPLELGEVLWEQLLSFLHLLYWLEPLVSAVLWCKLTEAGPIVKGNAVVSYVHVSIAVLLQCTCSLQLNKASQFVCWTQLTLGGVWLPPEELYTAPFFPWVSISSLFFPLPFGSRWKIRNKPCALLPPADGSEDQTQTWATLSPK